jgi:hypothetical protein
MDRQMVEWVNKSGNEHMGQMNSGMNEEGNKAQGKEQGS